MIKTATATAEATAVAVRADEKKLEKKLEQLQCTGEHYETCLEVAKGCKTLPDAINELLFPVV